MNFQSCLLVGVACASLGLAGCSRAVSPPVAVEGTPGNPPAIDAPEPAIGDPPGLDAPIAFNATMTGRAEVPAVYATHATGTGSFALDLARTTLSYTITHTVSAPTGAHVHLGIAGESGEILLPLAVAEGVMTGAVPVTPAQARAVEQGRAYVDVHSASELQGEIRGQIVRPGEIVYVARLTADQENPPSDTASDGLAQFLVDGTTNHLRFVVGVQGMSGVPTMAVIGTGPAGVDGPMAVDLAEPKTLPSSAFAGSRTLTSTEDLDLGRWYVNIHSRGFPGGEVRGQILRPGQDLYLGRMTGAESVPTVGTAARGSVSVIVDVDRDRIVSDVALVDLTPTTVSLAEGAVGVSAPPTILFQVPGSTYRVMRMLTPESTLLSSLERGNVYASAASAVYPDGEIRGQMRRVALPR